ncbi:MAG: NRDE family protein [Halarchaeum sp.]
MCTLAIAWQVYDHAPVVVAANRDESLSRPASPPAVTGDDPRVLAPRDESAGGTWTGVTDAGFYVGITNRWSDLESERSRGRLVSDALRAGSVRDASALVEREVESRDYAGFNLVLADADDAVLLEWDGRLRATTLDPGVRVVTTTGAPDAAGRRERVREALTARIPGTAAGFRGRAKRVLAARDVDACLHGAGYGTRSSSVITVADDRITYEFAAGPPCRTPYRRVGGFERERASRQDGHI